MDIVDWHAGFAPAMKLDLRDNEADLEYEEEHPIANRAQTLDLLIIKNDRRVTVRNTVGRIFDRFNILEYKGPGDKLNIGTYFKTLAYTCLYLEERHEYDADDRESYTISLVRYACLRKLFELLPRYGIRVRKRFQGIYELTGCVQFRTQIIVIRELPDDNKHIWLKCLTDTGGEKELKKVIKVAPSLDQKHKPYADSVMEVFIRGNVKELTNVKNKDGRKSIVCKAASELFAPEIQELKDIVKSKDNQLAQKEDQLAQKDSQIAEQSAKIAYLEKRLAAMAADMK